MRAAAVLCLSVWLASPVLASEPDSREEKKRLTPVCHGLIDPLSQKLQISLEHPRGCFLAAMHRLVDEAYGQSLIGEMESKSTLHRLEERLEYLQHQSEPRQTGAMSEQSIRVKELEIREAANDVAYHRAALHHWELARKLIEQALLEPGIDDAEFWADWISEDKIHSETALTLAQRGEELMREIVGVNLEINDMLQKTLDEADRLILEFEKERVEQMLSRLKS